MSISSVGTGERPKSFAVMEEFLDRIEGWLLPEAAAAWDCLLELQRRLGVTGNFLEIGVWRGKTASVMKYHHDPARERVVLVDKHFQRDIVDGALGRVPVVSNEVYYHQLDSHDLFYRENLEIEPGSARWIHIDGEHTGHAVLADLRAADRYLSQQGILCLDDFCDFQYVQITRAVFRYLDRYPDRLCLFNCGFKKAYLARPSFVHHYLAYCYDALVDDLEARRAFVTVSKTTTEADLDCFSMVPRYNDWRLRGPDWDKDRMEVSRTVSLDGKNRR